jgi:2-polyprenyl-3-methyl-5-hydroxy-6-metoxy-1,4-benzoquinol methylase
LPSQKLYDDYDSLKEWHAFFAPTSHEVDLFRKEFVGINLANKAFLDVGFGSGALLEWAKRQGSFISGIELQDKLLSIAANHGVAVYKDLKAVPDNTFDLITAFDVLEHIPANELADFINHLYRVTAPGGQIFLRFPNCQSLAGLAIQFGDHTHVTMLSGPLVQFLLKQAGWTNVVYRSARLMRSRTLVNRLIRLVLRPVTSLFLLVYRLTLLDRDTLLASNIMVIASKSKV